ncbi:MAG TPA: YggS family pyridoxal phosphate-dependent enzyme, partial [Xanthobacteraceae bacterium]|nr:YggS family pyridoxal phosphate-dependent enzyme [Xanthobacteraceae bacterium]
MNSAATIHAVNADIARACGDAGRDPATVTLIAISKTVPADDVAPVIAAGQRVFGENRVQEAKAKWPPLFARHQDLELHLVGALQSNKAKEAVALFHAIHSLDRERLAAALAKEIAAQRR